MHETHVLTWIIMIVGTLWGWGMAIWDLRGARETFRQGKQDKVGPFFYWLK